MPDTNSPNSWKSIAEVLKVDPRCVKRTIARAVTHVLGAKTVTLTETQGRETGTDRGKVLENSKEGVRWAHLDSNQGPTGYEPVALTS